MSWMKMAGAVAMLVIATTAWEQSADGERLRRFERQLEDLRRILQIPGMSAAIVMDRKLVWAKGSARPIPS